MGERRRAAGPAPPRLPLNSASRRKPGPILPPLDRSRKWVPACAGKAVEGKCWRCTSRFPTGFGFPAQAGTYPSAVRELAEMGLGLAGKPVSGLSREHRQRDEGRHRRVVMHGVVCDPDRFFPIARQKRVAAVGVADAAREIAAGDVYLDAAAGSESV